MNKLKFILIVLIGFNTVSYSQNFCNNIELNIKDSIIGIAKPRLLANDNDTQQKLGLTTIIKNKVSDFYFFYFELIDMASNPDSIIQNVTINQNTKIYFLFKDGSGFSLNNYAANNHKGQSMFFTDNKDKLLDLMTKDLNGIIIKNSENELYTFMFDKIANLDFSTRLMCLYKSK